MTRKWNIAQKGLVFRHPRADPYDRDSDRNFNHAASIVLMPDASLMTMWFSAPWEGHHYQALLRSQSFDGGGSWTAAQLFHDTHGMPDFDPAFVRCGDRVWTFFALGPRYLQLAGQVADRLLSKIAVLGSYSDDSGRTWTAPSRICGPEMIGTRSNGIQLRNGDILVPVHVRDIGYPDKPTVRCVASVLKSSDAGASWRKRGEMVAPYGTEEPTIVELSNGTVLVYFRTDDGYIWTAQSGDEAESWSEPVRTDIRANRSSHFLYKLRDGSIALVYNNCERLVRSPLVVRFSYDDARTWSEPLVLDHQDPPTSLEQTRTIHLSGADYGVCYPSMAENADGELLVVWTRYWISETEHCGDICFAKLS